MKKHLLLLSFVTPLAFSFSNECDKLREEEINFLIGEARKAEHSILYNKKKLEEEFDFWEERKKELVGEKKQTLQIL